MRYKQRDQNVIYRLIGIHLIIVINLEIQRFLMTSAYIMDGTMLNIEMYYDNIVWSNSFIELMQIWKFNTFHCVSN